MKGIIARGAATALPDGEHYLAILLVDRRQLALMRSSATLLEPIRAASRRSNRHRCSGRPDLFLQGHMTNTLGFAVANLATPAELGGDARAIAR